MDNLGISKEEYNKILEARKQRELDFIKAIGGLKISKEPEPTPKENNNFKEAVKETLNKAKGKEF